MTDTLTVTTWLPPSVNGIYRRTERGQLGLSNTATTFSQHAGWRALEARLAAGWSPPQQLGMHITLFSHTNILDIDNGLKLLIDALAHALQFNDKDIVELTVHKVTTAPGPLTITTIYPAKQGQGAHPWPHTSMLPEKRPTNSSTSSPTTPPGRKSRAQSAASNRK